MSDYVFYRGLNMKLEASWVTEEVLIRSATKKKLKKGWMIKSSERRKD